MRSRFAQLKSAVGHALPGLRAALALLGALCGAGALFRLRLALALRTGDTAAGIDVTPTLAEALRPLAADALLSIVAAALLLLVAQVLFRDRGRGPHPVTRALLVGLGAVGLLLLGALSQAHTGFLLATGGGLTVELLRETLNFEALRESMSLLTATDVLCVAAGPLIFLCGYLAPQRARTALGAAAGGLCAGLLGVGLCAPSVSLPPSLLHHPLGFVLADALAGVHSGPLAAAGGALLGTGHAADGPPGTLAGGSREAGEAGGDDMPADESSVVSAAPPPASLAELPPGQEGSLALLPPLFAHAEVKPQKTLPAAAGRPWNVVVILMESTGLEYALRPLEAQPGHGPLKPLGPEASDGEEGRVAMPFLRHLGTQGYLLANHFSTGNSSPRGIASLLDGLYVMPEVGIFDVRKDNYLPSLLTYLDRTTAPGAPRYRRFLVTPASLDWYFPHAMLAHSGLDELWGYHALPLKKNAPGGRAHARDEAETVRFFLHRLSEVAEPEPGSQPVVPFVAIYYSFIAHWPYVDYGTESHLFSPTRPIHAYYNNLKYLDQQLELIFNHCRDLGLLDNTIFVIAGDHGEAFGQHAHNYTHSRASFNENYRTPAILYQPKLFAPRVFTAPTSHVDVLPTVLDALGASYEPRLLQGESLFQDRFRRKYIFLYGNEDTSSSISEDSIKLQYSFKDNSCWVFDLKSDPEEKKRLGCQSYREQQRALLLYRNHQRNVLRRYSEATRTGQQFGGEAAPGTSR